MKRSCLIIALLFTITSASWANMLVDPGFETGGAWSKSGNVVTEWWAPRSGETGMVFEGWNPSPAGFSQEVAAVSGTYTFSIWVLQEANYMPVSTDLRIEWLNGSGASIQATTISNYNAFAKDASWHHIYVTGTCASPDLARVRVSVNASWAASGSDPRSFMVDDADLYSGPFVGTWLANGSFEQQGTWRSEQWNGTRDLWGDADGGRMGQDWAKLSGTSGVAFYSYANASTNYTVRFWQNVNPIQGTGTYTFALWLNQETNALFSNAQMRVEWYDNTFSNKVQADSVSNLTVPRDWNWHEFAVETVLTNPACYEARVVFSADWSYQALDGPGRATKLDDVRFLSVPYSEFTNAMLNDWCYHSGSGYNARNEQVPGTNASSFLRVDYGTTSVTFYVLANSPSQAKYYPAEGNRWELKTSWLPPTNNATWVDAWYDMTRIDDVVIPNGTPFHGLPTVGDKTVSLWRLVWPMPKNPSGATYTNRIPVFYAPFTKTTNSAQQTGYAYLLTCNGSATNNLGQQMGPDPYNRDYFLDLNPPKNVAFTNGGFEYPTADLVTLDGSGWYGIGDGSRHDWARRSGLAGAAFHTWGNGTFAFYQDVVTTGGTYQFSGYMKPETGAVPTSLEIKMEWYDKSGALVQENRQDLFSGLHQEQDWSHIGVVGSCVATDLDYVRLIVRGQFAEGADNTASTMFDDMEFKTVATSLQNAGFETGVGRSTPDWFMSPQWIVMIEGWAPHSGTNVMGFHAWETNLAQRFEASAWQPVAASNGTYEFSIWINRDPNSLLTNTQLKLQWYDGSYTHKVQADTVVTIYPVAGAGWAQFSITGTCNSASLRFVQPVVLAQWDQSVIFSSCNFFMDDAQLVRTGGESYTDGIPDSWWALYGITGGDRVAADDYDGDHYSNLEEYAGNTDPTLDTSYFPRASTVDGVRTVMYLIVNPSSSERAYDAWWKTNLLDSSAWEPYGLSVPGNGGSITLTVTNGPVYRFYRTGAKLP